MFDEAFKTCASIEGAGFIYQWLLNDRVPHHEIVDISFLPFNMFRFTLRAWDCSSGMLMALLLLSKNRFLGEL